VMWDGGVMFGCMWNAGGFVECYSTQSIDISFSLLIAVVWLGLYFVVLLVCSFLRMTAIEMLCCFGGIV
jgi:hypothetical protein